MGNLLEEQENARYTEAELAGIIVGRSPSRPRAVMNISEEAPTEILALAQAIFNFLVKKTIISREDRLLFFDSVADALNRVRPGLGDNLRHKDTRIL